MGKGLRRGCGSAWTVEDESRADEAVAQWNERPREKRRVSAVKRYIRELAVAMGAIGERCKGPSEGTPDGAVVWRPGVVVTPRGPGSARGAVNSVRGMGCVMVRWRNSCAVVIWCARLTGRR